MDRCQGCGFVYADHDVEDIADELVAVAGHYETRLRAASAHAQAGPPLRQRPQPGVWSAIEYACHVRDVLLTQRERLFLALVEDCPTFPPMYRDERVQLAQYATEDPAQVAKDIEMAANLIGRALTAVGESGWLRRCVYRYPEHRERTVAWLAQHTLHEAEHHLLDIDSAIERSTVR